MPILKALIDDRRAEWIPLLVHALQVDAEGAERFLPVAARGIVEAISSGSLDVAGVLGGDHSSLVRRVDSRRVGREAGIEPEGVLRGLVALVPVLLSGLVARAGGAENLLPVLVGSGIVGAAERLDRLGPELGGSFG